MTKSKRKIVFVGGCFDILHYGHIRFLREARKLGDYLIVALESDIGVRRLKGNGRPVHNEQQRKEILESLKFVDRVILLPPMRGPKDYEKIIIDIKPSILAVTKGDPLLKIKNAQAKQAGAKIIELPLIKTLSTTKIAKLLKIE